MMILIVGVGIIFWFDSRSATNTAVTTSPRGVVCAITGVLASALYTALVGSYQKRLQTNSMQLLLNQAPVSATMLLCMVPFLDTPPATTALSPSLYIAVLAVSGHPLPVPFQKRIELIANTLLSPLEWILCLSC
jgi:solute carrier family 35 protein E3